ncbi:MAG: rane fusion protein multidrug efflux system [Candidatus Binatota bacterium]|nr:rane fusion protein multidrug efflux system [Candidatus Binatota bacterium]
MTTPHGSERTGLLRIACGAATVVAALVSSACRKEAMTPPPAAEVFVVNVVEQDVPIYSEWVGTTDGFVNAQVRPRVQGYLLKQNYADGADVKAGQLLFQIDDREYKNALDQALGNLAQQRAALKKNQLDVARYTPLAAKGAVSTEELDDAVQAARGSQAQVEAAQAAVQTAKLDLGWTQVFAPIDGIAGIATVQVGDLVTSATLLTTVSQLNPIKVSFPISEQEYLRFAERIKEHQRTGRAKDEPDLELILADGSTYRYPGNFYVANRQVEIQTGTIQIQALFPNRDDILRPGQYAKVRAPIRVRRAALLVPQRAVQETQGQYQVAVVGPDNKVAFRTVKPSEQVGSLWIIDEGLHAGDRVVTEGLQKIKDGVVVNPKAAPVSVAETSSHQG